MDRIDLTAPPPPPLIAPLIAIVGCDGSGKSTLAAEIVPLIAREHPAARCYLGTGTGDFGNRIKRLPLLGPVTESLLSRRAGQTRDERGTIPGVGTALVVFGISRLRLRRFRQMLALRRRGVIAITDRYPQTEVAGFYDGPGLSAARAGSAAVARLAAREREMYRWMAGFVPDVVIRLNVDAATAHARKPDHRLESLLAKVAVTPLLRFNGAPIVDIDARLPYRQVRAQVIDIVRRTLAERGIALRLEAP